MIFTATIAVFGLASLGRSHMIMNTPVPYGHPNNSPLFTNGTNFPCKSDFGFEVTTLNVMPLGSTQPLKFTGTAVHGGGSCQISITYDMTPSQSSVFKVIHSIVGGCPAMKEVGNRIGGAETPDPDVYSFKIPDTLPLGNATLAWSWFNKVGNSEMYMNCAPIQLTSSTAKREEIVERDMTAFNALPNMFVANIPSIDGGCITHDSAAVMDTIFPQPGESVESLGTQTASAALAPTSCTVFSRGGSAGGSAATATSTAAGVGTAVSQATATATVLSGGVFATVATSAAVIATTSAAVIQSPAPIANPPPEASVGPTIASPAAPANTGITGTGSPFAAGSACTTEGMWNCIGGTSFQQCASGVWSAVGAVAAGTTCTSGQSSNINIVAAGSKRDARRSSHLRRHVQQS